MRVHRSVAATVVIMLASLSGGTLVTQSPIPAGASSSWSAYLRVCKPVLTSIWARDYNAITASLSTVNPAAISAAVNVLGRLGAVELNQCTRSPDAALNRDVSSLTYYQTMALTAIKAVAQSNPNVSVATALSLLTQMQNHERTVLARLARDLSAHG